MSQLRIAIAGASGRMGRMLIEAVLKDGEAVLASAFDRAGITAARSTRPFIVQAYARDMGGGKIVMMQEVDAPIRILGRHWGGLRTAYKA